MDTLRRVAFLAAVTLLSVTAMAWADLMMSVQVSSAKLLARPNYLAKVIIALPYGEPVTLMASEGDWCKVKTAREGHIGWVYTSTLTDGRIAVHPTNRDIRLARETGGVTLAGQGFNKQTEEKFRERSGLDFSGVDAMEASAAGQDDIKSFIKSGDLTLGRSQ